MSRRAEHHRQRTDKQPQAAAPVVTTKKKTTTSERRYAEDRIRVKHTQQSRSTRRLGEREVESDDALAEAALIVEQGGNDEKKPKSKVNCRHKRKEEHGQQQPEKNQKSIHPTAGEVKNIPQQQGNQRASPTAG